MYRFLFVFFFLSGFTSLVFEVLWERMLMQVFGSTSIAISTLLTAFMCGLAIGAWIGGRVAGRLKHPLRVYALLECGVGIWALCVPALLQGAETIYGVLFTNLSDALLAFSVARFAIVFAILVVPTTMMGASLPIVSQWISKHGAYEGRVGWLYATNTFGAFAGTFAAGFCFALVWIGPDQPGVRDFEFRVVRGDSRGGTVDGAGVRCALPDRRTA
ncbi:MAG: fused MFS/spermidine synthase [bacterium]